MEDEQRLVLFADFLKLPIAKLRQLALERWLVSRSTLDRIRGGHRRDTSHEKTRPFTELAKFIDPEYLARPSLPNDPFMASDVARRSGRTPKWRSSSETPF